MVGEGWDERSCADSFPLPVLGLNRFTSRSGGWCVLLDRAFVVVLWAALGINPIVDRPEDLKNLVD